MVTNLQVCQRLAVFTSLNLLGEAFKSYIFNFLVRNQDKAKVIVENGLRKPHVDTNRTQTNCCVKTRLQGNCMCVSATF